MSANLINDIVVEFTGRRALSVRMKTRLVDGLQAKRYRLRRASDTIGRRHI